MDQEHLRNEYLKIAFQYYISARVSMFAYSLPVAGNLYHHAIEMLLKFSLLTKFTPFHLQTKFGHNLEKLWKEYKKLYPDKTLSKYNSLIKKINHFEDLRYPKNKGYAIYADRRKHGYSYSIGPKVKGLKEYRLN